MMKYLGYLLFTIFAVQLQAQPAKPDPLAFDDTTVALVKHTVDSLHTLFAKLPIPKIYALPQARAHVIKIDSVSFDEVMADLDRGISFDAFVQKYPNVWVRKNVVILKSEIPETKEIYLTAHRFGVSIDGEITLPPSAQSDMRKGKVVYNYHPTEYWHDAYLVAHFFITDFKAIQIPDVYATQIAYTNFMADTTVHVTSPRAKQEENIIFDPASKYRALISIVQYDKARPNYTYEWKGHSAEALQNWHFYQEKLQIWHNGRNHVTDSLYEHDTQFKALLDSAVQEFLQKHDSHYAIDEYVERYLGKQMALDVKQNCIVYGSCGEDDSPYIHRFEIAKLAAELQQVPLMLHAFMEMFSERNRVAENGYIAGSKRQTFVYELENCGLDFAQVMFGMYLDYQGKSQNALKTTNYPFTQMDFFESANTDAIFGQIIKAISDENLDDYNRTLLLKALYDSFPYHPTEAEKAKVESVKTEIKKLPLFLYDQVYEEWK